MARRWRVLNRRRARKLRRAAQPACGPWEHTWVNEYYGHQCRDCNQFYPYGHAPWEVSDYPDDYDYEFGDGDDDCFHCGGDGYIDGYEDDPLWFEPGETERCSSCGGSGRATDMTIW